MEYFRLLSQPWWVIHTELRTILITSVSNSPAVNDQMVETRGATVTVKGQIFALFQTAEWLTFHSFKYNMFLFSDRELNIWRNEREESRQKESAPVPWITPVRKEVQSRKNISYTFHWQGEVFFVTNEVGFNISQEHTVKSRLPPLSLTECACVSKLHLPNHSNRSHSNVHILYASYLHFIHNWQ